MKNTLMWLVVLVVVVVAGHYGYKYMQGGYQAPSPSTEMVTTVPNQTGGSSATGAANSVFMTKTSASLGSYMTGPNGMTLYTFTKDTAGVSNCNGSCATLWPPYTATSQAGLPSGVTVITRADGSMQYAWNGMPLYYYTPDKNPGDTTGQGVGGVWFVAK